MHADNVNGADWRVRQGAYRPGRAASLPTFHILGRDFSGVVSAVATNTDLAIGDRVFGVCDNAGGVLLEGASAERIAMRAAILARKPDALTHVEAAAVALIGVTTVVSIEDTLQLRARRDHPHPGRRRGSGRICRPARQAPRCPGDHHRQRRQLRLCATARRRRDHRLPRGRLRRSGLRLRRGVRHRRPRRDRAVLPGGEAGGPVTSIAVGLGASDLAVDVIGPLDRRSCGIGLTSNTSSISSSRARSPSRRSPSTRCFTRRALTA